MYFYFFVGGGGGHGRGQGGGTMTSVSMNGARFSVSTVVTSISLWPNSLAFRVL